jgi:hypothetical protein
MDSSIPYRVLIIEQEGGLPVNRGALKNIGFLLGCEDSDYTAFHDVDYLPIWADYSYVEDPTPIVWYGAETRPIAANRSNMITIHNLDLYFGGVVLVPNAQFRCVNGFATTYWGWGYEDEDLRNRFGRARITLGRRKGTFSPLLHDNEGYTLEGQPSEIARVNSDIFDQRNASPVDERDGISTTHFEILQRKSIPNTDQPERAALWEMVTVRLRLQPTRRQLDALNATEAQQFRQNSWKATIKY